MYALELDIKITRRQRLNTIRDEHGNLVFTCTKPSDAFAWLWERGVKEFRLDNEDQDGNLNSYYLDFHKDAYRQTPD